MKTFQLTQVAALIVAASAADIKPYGQVPAATVLEQVEAEAQHCPCHDHDHCDCDNEPLVAVNVYEADECCDSDPESEPIPDPEPEEPEETEGQEEPEETEGQEEPEPVVCPTGNDCGDYSDWCNNCPNPDAEGIVTYEILFDHFVNKYTPNDIGCLDICEFLCIM